MCTRMTLKTPAEALARQFGVDLSVPFAPNYNLAPTDPVAIYRLTADSLGARSRPRTEGARSEPPRALALARAPETLQPQLTVVRWGLVPFWSKDLSGGARMVNARVETVAQKPAFKESFERRRCLVLADGFYEWKKEGDLKQPYYFRRVDRTPFALAGLWARWWPKDVEDVACVESCAVLTLEAEPPFSRIHTRMPAVLSSENHERWLTTSDPVLLEGIARGAKEVLGPSFESFPVSTYVNNVRSEGPRCIEPLVVPPPQGTLF